MTAPKKPKSLGAKAAKDLNETLRVFFLRDKRKYPVACVATTKRRDRIYYGVATFNPHDIFNRELARKIAVERLENRAQDNLSFEATAGVKVRVIQSIAQDKRTKKVRSRKEPQKTVVVPVIPRRTREAAQYWLAHPELHPRRNQEA